ncbi:MAG: hypothetical protein ACK5MU_01435 [Candidatus Saccharimonadales bacterium]
MHVATLLTAVHKHPTVNLHLVERLLDISDTEDFADNMALVAGWQKRGFSIHRINLLLDGMERSTENMLIGVNKAAD